MSSSTIDLIFAIEALVDARIELAACVTRISKRPAAEVKVQEARRALLDILKQRDGKD